MHRYDDRPIDPLTSIAVTARSAVSLCPYRTLPAQRPGERLRLILRLNGSVRVGVMESPVCNGPEKCNQPCEQNTNCHRDPGSRQPSVSANHTVTALSSVHGYGEIVSRVSSLAIFPLPSSPRICAASRIRSVVIGFHFATGPGKTQAGIYLDWSLFPPSSNRSFRFQRYTQRDFISHQITVVV